MHLMNVPKCSPDDALANKGQATDVLRDGGTADSLAGSHCRCTSRRKQLVNSPSME